MELCENGTLNGYLSRQGRQGLTEERIWRFFIEICLGIQYLHANRILHRDIKTDNIFLTKNDSIRIGDLGLAK
jgi:NIMA (never in mitosis gene a)-related kinase